MTINLAPRPAWSNRFRAPSPDELRAQMPKPALAVFDDARARLMACVGVAEFVCWQGVPWRWTLMYSQPVSSAVPPGGAGREPPDAAATSASVLAYLIPDPQRLQICVPLNTEHLTAMPLKRMKKWIRDGLVFSRAVGGTCWPTWDLTATTQLDDVADLIVRKHKLSLAHVEAAVPVGA